MSDRTTTSLTVLKEHEAQVIELIQKEEGNPDDCWEENERVCLTYHGVNYGRIGALEALVKQGIAYSFSWDNGVEFAQGEEHVRFTAEGELQSLTQEKEWPEDTLRALLQGLSADTPADVLWQTLQQALAQYVPLPWDNQAEYGKRFLARQLITP